MFEPLLSVDGLISLLTLVLMEVVLGIDNIIFISILCDRLPQEQQQRARSMGLVLALVFRIALLFGIAWLIGLKEPFLVISESIAFSGRDLILLAGGLFLLAKSTTEIHGKIEGRDHDAPGNMKKTMTFSYAIFQIVLLDAVFSFDSILTAVGLVDPDKIIIMVVAVIISMIVMLAFARYVSDFINKHPTIKMLALSFLLMIGLLLVVEAFHVHVPKGYIYFAMAYALLVEILNMRVRRKMTK